MKQETDASVKMSQMAVKLPKDLHDEIKIRAIRHNEDLKEWVIKACVERMGREDEAQ